MIRFGWKWKWCGPKECIFVSLYTCIHGHMYLSMMCASCTPYIFSLTVYINQVTVRCTFQVQHVLEHVGSTSRTCQCRKRGMVGCIPYLWGRVVFENVGFKGEDLIRGILRLRNFYIIEVICGPLGWTRTAWYDRFTRDALGPQLVRKLSMDRSQDKFVRWNTLAIGVLSNICQNAASFYKPM